jgi:hypothetical protein
MADDIAYGRGRIFGGESSNNPHLEDETPDTFCAAMLATPLHAGMMYLTPAEQLQPQFQTQRLFREDMLLR